MHLNNILLYLHLKLHWPKMSLLLLPFRKRNAFSVEALITSDAVVLLGMLCVMNAEKLDTSLRFVARSLLARRVRISRLHSCLSTTSLPWSEPRLAYILLLLTLKSRDCQPVLCWTLRHRTVTLTLKLQKKLGGLECKGQNSSIALASTASSAKVRGVVNCNMSAF